MKYDEKYKTIPIMELGDNTYLRCAEPHPCCVCGDMTYFCEINYEGYFCSEECERIFANEMEDNGK